MEISLMFRLNLALVVLFVAANAGAEPRVYTAASEKSQVRFEAKYPLGDFSGTTDKVTGEFRIDRDNVTQSVTGTAIVNPADLRTGIEGRDRDLRKILETDTYPEIRFRVEQIQASFPSLAERADITLTIGGILQIRGVERQVTWTGRARIEEGRVWVRGEAELRMTDFGITLPRKFFLTVADGIRVGFDLRLAPKE